MILRLAGVIVVTTILGLGVCVYAHFSNARVVAESEYALAYARSNMFGLLREKYSDQWPALELLMKSQYGPEWTNELSGKQLIAIQEAVNDPLFTMNPSAED